MAGNFEMLFTPFKIGPMELRNRIVMAAMTTNFAEKEGFVTERMIRYYEERAKGGAGLIIVEGAFPDPGGRAHLHSLLINDDKFIPGLSKLAKAVKRHGAKAALQLNHVGRAAPSKFTGRQPVAPSNVPTPLTKEEPKELTADEIKELVALYGAAALRAKNAGFDAVDIIASTGFLISQFLSPATNKRNDAYGGDLERRMKFFLEIINSVRRGAGDDFPALCKISADEYIPGGQGVEEAKIIAKRAQREGISAIQVFAGWYESTIPMLPMSVPRGFFAFLAEEIKKVLTVPVMIGIRINDPAVAEEILRKGKADLVVMGRPLIADPELPNKAKAGQLEDIRMCLACNEGCFERLNAEVPITCAVNALVGREGEVAIGPADAPKKVLVIGGGPAGMEAARVAALRGHDVTLCEKKQTLGGNLLLATVPPYKEEINNIINYLRRQMKNLKVKLTLGRGATPDVIREMKPDVVILTTGAEPIVPDISGVESENVVLATELLAGAIGAPGDVAVIGGGMVGLESAEYLAGKGGKVTVLEMLPKVGLDIGASVRWTLLKRLREANIAILTNAEVTEITGAGVVYTKDGKREKLDAQSVVLAVGLKPVKKYEEAIKSGPWRVIEAGDCVKPQKIIDAIHSGFKAALEV